MAVYEEGGENVWGPEKGKDGKMLGFGGVIGVGRFAQGLI